MLLNSQRLLLGSLLNSVDGSNNFVAMESTNAMLKPTETPVFNLLTLLLRAMNILLIMRRINDLQMQRQEVIKHS
jgi:hypothetical protein